MRDPIAPSTSGKDEASPLVAILIPAKDEADNLPGLFIEIDASLSEHWSFEVVVIDDGSTDGTQTMLLSEMSRWPWLRALRHVESAGKSAAIRTGALATEACFIVTMDGDG